MKSFLLIITLGIGVLLSTATVVSAKPLPSSAICNITCTVADIAEWSQESFPPIQLDLKAENEQTSGSSSLALYANGDVEITADNSDAAQLSKNSFSKLTTEYKLESDNLAGNPSGTDVSEWSSFDSFLEDGTTITHIPNNGAIEIILSVKAVSDDSSPASPGFYQASQTLTVCWK
jgi:hypothetical protein